MLVLESVIEQLKGQLTCHARVSGQNASSACADVSHFAEFTDGFFFLLSCRPILFVIILVIKFCETLLWLQTELDSTRS